MIREILGKTYGDDLRFMDGFDDCIEGVVECFGQPNIVCYDKAKVIAKLMEDGIEEEEAEEYFNFNQLGAYVGETTPCFLTKINYNKPKLDNKQELCKKIMLVWDELCKHEPKIIQDAKKLEYSFIDDIGNKMLTLSIKELNSTSKYVVEHFCNENLCAEKAMADIGLWAFTESDDSTYDEVMDLLKK